MGTSKTVGFRAIQNCKISKLLTDNTSSLVYGIQYDVPIKNLGFTVQTETIELKQDDTIQEVSQRAQAYEIRGTMARVPLEVLSVFTGGVVSSSGPGLTEKQTYIHSTLNNTNYFRLDIHSNKIAEADVGDIHIKFLKCRIVSYDFNITDDFATIDFTAKAIRTINNAEIKTIVTNETYYSQFYLIQYGTAINSLSSLVNFVAANGTIVQDTVNGGIELTASAAGGSPILRYGYVGTNYLNKDLTTILEANGSYGFDIYIPDLSKINTASSLNITFNQDSGNTIKMFKSLTTGATHGIYLRQGLNHIRIGGKEFTAYGGDGWNINEPRLRFQFQFPSKTGEIGKMTLVRDYLNEKHMSIFCYTFDDTLLTQYTVGFPMLLAYGFKATLFPIPERIGIDDLVYYNWNQLKEMKTAGWEVGLHGLNRWDTMTEAEFNSYIVTSESLFTLNGVSITKVAAYPDGQRSDLVDSILTTRGYKIARLAENPSYETINRCPDSYLYNGIVKNSKGSGASKTFLTDFKPYIDRCLGAGDHLYRHIHGIVSNPSGSEQDTEELQLEIDYLYENRAYCSLLGVLECYNGLRM